MLKTFGTLLTAALFAVPLVATPASAGVEKPLRCVASDPAFVVVNSATDTASVTDNPVTEGNHFGCYTNLSVKAGQTITFNYAITNADGTPGDCGGGVPRVYVRFEGNTPGENTTMPGGTCGGGTVTYTLASSGRIKSFAFISDSTTGSTVTYSNLVIGGTRVNF